MAQGERILRLVREQFGSREEKSGDAGGGAAGGGMDRAIARLPGWRRYWPYGAGALAVVAVAAWLLSGPGGNVYRVPLDRLTISSVTEGPFEDFAAVRSTVAPFETEYLTAEQGGTVEKVLVEDGTVVKKGQPLIVLANSQLALQVASREAETARQISDLQNTELQLEQTRFKYQKDVMDIEYQLKTLKGELERDARLDAVHAIAPATYEEAKEKYAYQKKLRDATVASHNNEQAIRTRQLAQLKDTLDQLNANLKAGRASLDALTIRAPVDGRLTALDAQAGQSKTQGAVLGQVDSQDRFKLTAQVDEFYLGRVARGQEALFSVDGHKYRARVAKIYPQVTNGTFKVDLYFAGTPPAGIHAGQAVDVKLELGGATKALMLPNGPFYQDTGGNWVFVVGPDGQTATRRNVRLGRRNPEYVEVLDGLKAGDRVVTSSYTAFVKMDRLEFSGTSADQS